MNRVLVFAVLVCTTIVATGAHASSYYLVADLENLGSGRWDLNWIWNTQRDNSGSQLAEINPGSSPPLADMTGLDVFTNGNTLRTTNVANPTFAGNSITIEKIGSNEPLLMLKGSGTVTIPRLDSTGGVITAANAQKYIVAAQNMKLTGSKTYLQARNNTAQNDRGVELDIDNLSGNADLQMGWVVNDDDFYGLTVDDASGYTGDIYLAYGQTSFGNNLNISNSKLQVLMGGDYTAEVELDQDITVGELVIGSTSYGPGTYDFITLEGAHPDQFVNGGTGSITVIPEPASLMLAIGGSLAMVMARRQRR